MAMLQTTQEILNKALDLTRKYNLSAENALNEAFSDEIGFGSTDMLSRAVLGELHALGMLKNHYIH